MSTGKRQKRNRSVKEAEAPVAVAEASAKVEPKSLKWRWPFLIGSLIGLSLLVLFISWLQLFDQLGVDRRLRDLLISQASSTMARRFDGRVWTILVDEKKQNDKSEAPAGSANPSHRKAHAQLLRKLTAAGTKVVVFDVEFEDDVPEVDNDFAAAIQEAERAGTKVVVGGFLLPDQYEPSLSKTLKPAIGGNWGIIDGAMPTWKSEARFVRLVAENSEHPSAEPRDRSVIPSISLLALARFRYPNENVSAWYNPLASEVRLRRESGELLESIPVDGQLDMFIDLVGADEMPLRTYEQVFDHFSTYADRFKNAIILIGYKHDDVVQTSGGPRFGVEMHANAVSTLLKKTYVRPLPFAFHLAAIVGLIAVGACLQIRCSTWMNHKLTVPIPITLPPPFDKIQIPTAIVVIIFIYVFGAILAFKWGHIVFDMSYHLAALILTYTLFVLFRSRLTVP